LILNIKSFFNNIGTISFNNQTVVYKVRKLNDITNYIIPHFDAYPLLTQKQKDFFVFKSIIFLMKDNKHLNKNYLNDFITLKAFLNKGLSNNLKTYFPNIQELSISFNNNLKIDPY
jgi:hypothetical protein